MKPLFYLLFLILVVSCGSKIDQEQEATRIDSALSKTIEIIDTSRVNEKLTGPDTAESLDVFKHYALSYNPWKVVLPETPDSILTAIEVVKSTKPDAFEQYLTLIFLKLCKARLQCCRETYELEAIVVKPNALVTEFKALTKAFVEERQIEFSPSRTAYHYVYDNQHLRKFRPINREYNLIVELRMLEDS